MAHPSIVAWKADVSWRKRTWKVGGTWKAVFLIHSYPIPAILSIPARLITLNQPCPKSHCYHYYYYAALILNSTAASGSIHKEHSHNLHCGCIEFASGVVRGCECLCLCFTLVVGGVEFQVLQSWPQSLPPRSLPWRLLRRPPSQCPGPALPLPWRSLASRYVFDSVVCVFVRVRSHVFADVVLSSFRSSFLVSLLDCWAMPMWVSCRWCSLSRCEDLDFYCGWCCSSQSVIGPSVIMGFICLYVLDSVSMLLEYLTAVIVYL